MKFIQLSVDSTAQEYLDTVRDNRVVNEGVRFGKENAYPTAEIREGKRHLRIRCRMVGGATRDNGFIFGTFFFGTLRQKNDGCRLRGVIVTEPLIHLIWIAFIVYYVITCIQIGGISLVPIFLSLLMFFMFKSEYKKQGILARYLARAAHRVRRKDVRATKSESPKENQ